MARVPPPRPARTVGRLCGSGLRDGNRHDPHNLPTVLAGRGGGTLAPGRDLIYGNDTPLCNLYVSMLDRVGAPVPRFADSTGPLEGLDNPEYAGRPYEEPRRGRRERS